MNKTQIFVHLAATAAKLTKKGVLFTSGGPGFARIGAALRVGLPPLGPGAVVRPRPSFGGAAPPRAALRRALPFGPLGGGCRWAPLPPAPLPLRGRGVWRLRRWWVKHDNHSPRQNRQPYQDTASHPPPRIRVGARGPGPRPIGER